ncbi:hypothetical protein H8E07_01180 [bacterium]|nr:hypothetical protein [bacterium]
MTPEEIVKRRESRIDALMERVEGGGRLTADDWQQLDDLNTLDLMSAATGGASEILEREAEADGAVE